MGGNQSLPGQKYLVGICKMSSCSFCLKVSILVPPPSYTPRLLIKNILFGYSDTFLTLQKQFKYTENFTTKNWKFSNKNSDIFHVSAQNTDCGYLLEPPCQGCSNKYPQSMFLSIWGSCKKFCQWVRITSVLRFIKHIFITNLQSIPPLLKHIFVTLLPSHEKQINTCSLLLVSVGEENF